MLRSLMDAGDFDAAKRLAHTVKGIAGSIGAGALRIAAEALEKDLSAEDVREAASLTEKFADALEKDCTEALNYICEGGSRPDGGNGPPEADGREAALVPLVDALRNGDSEANEIFRSCSSYLKN
jgi:two-component system sensor histidine kinase/response regulator